MFSIFCSVLELFFSYTFIVSDFLCALKSFIFPKLKLTVLTSEPFDFKNDETLQ